MQMICIFACIDSWPLLLHFLPAAVRGEGWGDWVKEDEFTFFHSHAAFDYAIAFHGQLSMGQRFVNIYILNAS